MGGAFNCAVLELAAHGALPYYRAYLNSTQWMMHSTGQNMGGAFNCALFGFAVHCVRVYLNSSTIGAEAFFKKVLFSSSS